MPKISDGWITPQLQMCFFLCFYSSKKVKSNRMIDDLNTHLVPENIDGKWADECPLGVSGQPGFCYYDLI